MMNNNSSSPSSPIYLPYSRSILAPDRPVVLVLGASRGIGIAMTHDLIRLGAHVMIVSRDLYTMQALRETYPRQVDFVCINLTLPGAAQTVINATVQRWNKIDAMIVNHGVLPPLKRVENSSLEEDWMHVFNTNFFSAVMLCKYAIPHLRSTRGRIIFVSAPSQTHSAWGPYSASKAALEQLSRTIAAEEPKIKCVSISPDPVDTGMQEEIRRHSGEQMDPEARDGFERLYQQDKLLRPEKVAALLVRAAIWATTEMSGKHYRWGDKKLNYFESHHDQYRVYRTIREDDNWPRNELGHSLQPLIFYDTRNTLY